MPESRPLSRRVLAASALALVASGCALREPDPTSGAGASAGGGGATKTRPPSPVPAPTTVTPTVDRAALTAELDTYRSKRGGTMGLAVHDLRSGETFEWRPFTNESLSTVKVLILLACLRRVEEEGTELSDTRRTQARRMIQRSDNASTDALLAWVGTPAVQGVAAELGLAETTVIGGSAGGWWGYSTTTPGDLVKAMDAVVVGTDLVHAEHRAYVRTLMAGVVPEQRWGVANPPLPDGVLTETKNGWGPMADGYRLNSIGRVLGERRHYTMAVLTRSPQGFRYGKATINGLSEIVYEALELDL